MSLSMILVGELLLTAPMVPRNDVGVYKAPALEAQAGERTPAQPLARVVQLTNPRTGTTCTMQILRARPVDEPSARPAPAEVDPGIRARGVSRCLE
jgi:hypothetical protein